MQRERIITELKQVLDEDFGFEIYVVLKGGEQRIKKFILDEENTNGNIGFKEKIRNSIEETIRNKFLSEESQYADGNDLANEQSCFYVIRQDETYQPFDFLKVSETQVENFRLADKDNADAVIFKLSYQRNGNLKQLWAYQKILPAAIPNRQNKHFQFIVKSREQTDVFKELEDQMFIITKKVDLLILGDEIITDEIKLMERHLGLETFIRESARRAVTSITTVGLVENDEKFYEYIQRPNKRYAKKMMQIHKFPVAEMSKELLLQRLYTVERWKNKFEIEGDHVHLRNFKDVENIIDLFTERYTRSDVTGQEYDTSVKDKAEPVDGVN